MSPARYYSPRLERDLISRLTGRIHRVDANAMQQKAAAPAIGAWMKEPEELRRLADEGAEVAALGESEKGS